MRDRTRQYRAELRFLVSSDPAQAIGAELARDLRAIAALTTHGRTAWAEAILGSVTLRVTRESKRPVIVFRLPEDKNNVPEKIITVAVALDGGDFSEKMVRHAVKAAQFLSARLLLLQALPVLPQRPASDRLEKRRGEIVNTLDHVGKERRGAEDNREWIDPAAYTSRIGLFDRLTGWYLDELALIDQALIRIADNRYGLCLTCHQAIEPMRLEIEPDSVFCAGCQELREQVAEVWL